MDFNLALQLYIVQGYIDAKDDRGRTIYGSFLSAVSRRDLKFLSVAFGSKEIEKDTPWLDLLELHTHLHDRSDRDLTVRYNEDELHKYLSSNLVLNGIAKNLNAKPAEQAISRFCLDHMRLKSVCFINFFEASDEDLALLHHVDDPVASPAAPKVKTSEESVPDEPHSSGENKKAEKDLFLKCYPVLDPVRGVAANELKIGRNIYGKLAQDSIFYKLLAKNNRSFDGTIIATVTDLLISETGTSTISLNISDGVSGVMKLPGKVKIKMARGQEDNDFKSIGRNADLWNLPPEVVFIGACITIIGASMFLIYYLFLM
jgi:hypothetical protein